jgi:CRP/FNR family transcriptional regulator
MSRVWDMFGTDCHVFLSPLSDAKQELLLERSRRVRYPAGTVRYLPEQPNLADILERGLLRIFATSKAGREATIRYIHPGEFVGPITVGPSPNRVYVQAITDVEVVALDLTVFWSLMETDAEMALALAADLGSRYSHAIKIIAVRSFGGIRERLAFDLLDRACNCQLASGELIANAGQQELADAIGSVREVVARTLRELRAEGIVATRPGHIRVLDVMRLENIVATAAP